MKVQEVKKKMKVKLLPAFTTGNRFPSALISFFWSAARSSSAEPSSWSRPAALMMTNAHREKRAFMCPGHAACLSAHFNYGGIKVMKYSTAVG